MNLNRLGYFAAVVDTGSFTRAAERLGITKTVVSQQVARLEQELQTTLLVRTTRRVEPTEAGRLLHARSVRILADAEDAFGEVARSRAEPTGLLRIAAPNDYGACVIAPIAAAFAGRYPACQVDLRLSDTRVDPIAHHIDLSIRVGWLEDSGLQARRIGAFRQHLVAAPDVARTLALRTPDDLAPRPSSRTARDRHAPCRAGRDDLIVLDRARRTSTRISRDNLYRIGAFTDWFDLAHGLRHPRAAYRLTSTAGSVPATLPATPAACRWYDLAQAGGVAHICWDGRDRFPLLIATAAWTPVWRVVSLDRAPIPAGRFALDDRGYVRNDADRDVEGD